MIETSISEIKKLILKHENILDREFRSRREYGYTLTDPEIYEMFLVMVKNIRDFRKCLKILKSSVSAEGN